MPYQQGDTSLVTDENDMSTSIIGKQEQVEINFTKEPRKCKRQLLKLLDVVQKYCKTQEEVSIQEKHEEGQQIFDMDRCSQDQPEKMDQLAQITL